MSGSPDGYVLAGGRSRRMGVDKGRLAWEGQPLAERVADVLSSACGRVMLVRRGPWDGLPWRADLRVVRDPDDLPAAAARGHHPLWGVVAALHDAGSDTVLIAPCDVPFLTVDDVRRLVEAGPSVAAAGTDRQPLIAHLPRTWAQRAVDLASRGAPAHALVEGLPVIQVPRAHIQNVNRPSDRPEVGPVGHLLDRLAWLDDATRDRVEEGERLRLAVRGMVDMSYSPRPRREPEDG